ncbi:hypothetical protein FHG87_017670 [Trinorchestia longiramus]|nr:hypothetical protein FHG87_017670 [Trinorchestia longiramus]
MPPTAVNQRDASVPWEMATPGKDLLSSQSYGAQNSPRSETSCVTSCSPQSQPDSGLQSTDWLSEDEAEEAKTLTKQTEAEQQRVSRAGKAERQKAQPAPYNKFSRPGSPKVVTTKTGPLQHLEKVATAESEAERWLASLVASIQVVLSVDKFADFQCVAEAKKLAEMTKRMAEGHQLHHLLRVFGHSASCNNNACVSPCLMFRRIRGHLVSIDHECAIVHVYSQLTRMHVDTCVTEKCGFLTCKGLQAYRTREQNEVLPRNFYMLERDNAVALAKPAPDKIEAKSDEEPQKPSVTLAGKENVVPKQATHALVKKEGVDETSEALDLSHRVSKLQMGSTQSRFSART